MTKSESQDAFSFLSSICQDKKTEKKKLLSEQLLIKMNVKIRFKSKESEEHQMQEPKRIQNETKRKKNITIEEDDRDLKQRLSETAKS